LLLFCHAGTLTLFISAFQVDPRAHTYSTVTR
jgi:hypothetical protein